MTDGGREYTHCRQEAALLVNEGVASLGAESFLDCDLEAFAVLLFHLRAGVYRAALLEGLGR